MMLGLPLENLGEWAVFILLVLFGLCKFTIAVIKTVKEKKNGDSDPIKELTTVLRQRNGNDSGEVLKEMVSHLKESSQNTNIILQSTNTIIAQLKDEVLKGNEGIRSLKHRTEDIKKEVLDTNLCVSGSMSAIRDGLELQTQAIKQEIQDTQEAIYFKIDEWKKEKDKQKPKGD